MLSYFDCNVCLGKRGPKHPLEWWTTEDVLAEMERCGISGALCYAGPAKDYSPRYGNEWLYEELKKSPLLHGCYTVCPNLNGEFLDPKEMIADMRAKNMLAARMFPRSHGYTPDETVMGPVYTALEDAGFALFVDNSEINLDQIPAIMSAHKKLNIVLTGVTCGQERMLFALLDRFVRLHVDLSALQTNRMPELMYEKHGWGRVLFGSGMPIRSLGAARAFFDHAEVFLPALRDFACGNICNLLRMVRPEPREPKCDEIAMALFQGNAISVPVLDAQANWQPAGHNSFAGYVMPEADADAMCRNGKKLGVDGACVAPCLGFNDAAASNEAVKAMEESHPSEVFPCVMIDPSYGDDVNAMAKQYHEKLHFPGMKLSYRSTQLRYTDPVFAPWWEMADRHGLFALLEDTDYPTFLEDAPQLAQQYPNVSLLLDHAGESFEAISAYGALAKQYANVYLQLTCTASIQGLIEHLCADGLADKALYATNAPMRDPRPQLGWVAAANISPEDKKKLLGGNMQKILDKVHF